MDEDDLDEFLDEEDPEETDEVDGQCYYYICLAWPSYLLITFRLTPQITFLTLKIARHCCRRKMHFMLQQEALFANASLTGCWTEKMVSVDQELMAQTLIF